ncbi:hypothetical protein PoB_004166300 [Plakobranchus ocellatus]|uniref:Ig-like domain-containing protein n=1 Tax=Plakobranchus ocellatus TaxID=259542 RepID=A0AAV4B6C0_9GAST|nr:hypothetical protein PoB_004166300 [Plakobranchus ocellatus]
MRKRRSRRRRKKPSYTHWDVNEGNFTPLAWARHFGYVARNGLWRLSPDYDFKKKPYVCQSDVAGQVKPISSHPKIALIYNFTVKNRIEYGQKLSISCTAFHTDGASLYFTLSASGSVTEAKYPISGDKVANVIEDHVFEKDGADCRLKSTALWHLLVEEKHHKATFSCCRTHPKACVNSPKLTVDLLYMEPKVEIRPTNYLESGQETTANCTLYYGKWKLYYWVIEKNGTKTTFRVDQHGILYEPDPRTVLKWRIIGVGNPDNYTNLIVGKDEIRLKHPGGRRPYFSLRIASANISAQLTNTLSHSQDQLTSFFHRTPSVPPSPSFSPSLYTLLRSSLWRSIVINAIFGRSFVGNHRHKNMNVEVRKELTQTVVTRTQASTTIL